VENGSEKPKTCPFHCIRTCDYTRSPYCISQALFQAAKGNMKKGYVFAGFNAHLAKKINTVKEVIALLKADFLLARQRTM
jgi:NAD(P)H-dependent flavin oxidoreductase YrpB (nitropropane dioxygenase family)